MTKAIRWHNFFLFFLLFFHHPSRLVTAVEKNFSMGKLARLLLTRDKTTGKPKVLYIRHAARPHTFEFLQPDGNPI